MGIRMLHRRTAQARTQAQANADATPSTPLPPVQAFAADASTARIPTDPVTALRQAAAALRHRLAALARNAVSDRGPDTAPGAEPPRRRQWADLGRGCLALGRSYVALALTRLPRSRPKPTITVFIAPGVTGPVSERPDGSPSGPGRPLPKGQGPGPDATP